RLATAGVVRDRDEHDRYVRGAFLEQGLERLEVHVSLERMEGLGAAALGDHEIDRLGTGRLDVGPGRVEVRVVRVFFSRYGDHREQDLLGRPPLMGRDDVPEREQLLYRLEEHVPGRRARVAL